MAETLSQLAGVLQANFEYARAKKLFRRSLQIFERTQGAAHHDVEVCMQRLAALFEAQGDYAGAKRLLLRVLALQERNAAIKPAALAATLKNLARFFFLICVTPTG